MLSTNALFVFKRSNNLIFLKTKKLGDIENALTNLPRNKEPAQGHDMAGTKLNRNSQHFSTKNTWNHRERRNAQPFLLCEQ